MHDFHSTTRRQRGAASLVVTALLVFAMLLVVAFANRNVVVEARASANQYRGAQAFEAAEAGLEWALARLNDDTPIGDDCRPSADAGALSFRDRHLRYDGTSASVVALTWDDAGTPRPLQAACVRGDAGWSCSCPSNGVPVLPVAASTATAPTFTVELDPGAKPGLVNAVATGCTRSDVACAATSDTTHEAAARIEVGFGLVPGLRAVPVAALTARGDVVVGAAGLGVHNLDVDSAGLAVHAGGSVSGDALRLGVPAGSSLEGSVVAGDIGLASLAGDRFFARWFGMDQATWKSQPAVTRIECADACANTVAQAAAGGHRLIAVDGDLTLEGPLSLGTNEQPIVLVVNGALHLHGAVALVGVVAAGSLDWNDAGVGASVRGAALSESGYGGNAQADFVHDSTLLARLQHGSGSFARVDASWKDF